MLTRKISSKNLAAAALLAGLALAAGPARAAQPTVAVFDFDLGNTVQVETEVRGEEGRETVSLERSRQSNLLTNRLVHELVNSGEVSVVEREEISRIMDEARFSQSDLTDPSRAMEIGKLLGADYMIFGAITTVDPRVEVTQLPYDAGTEKRVTMTVGANARLVKAETGVVEASAERQAKNRKSGSGRAGQDVSMTRGFQQETYSKLAGLLATDLLNTLNPLKVARQSGDQVYLARAGLHEGLRCEVSSAGETITDPDTGEVLGTTRETVALVEVTDGLDKMSVARVVEWKREDQTIEPGAACRPVDG